MDNYDEVMNFETEVSEHEEIINGIKKLVEDKLNPQGITFVQNNGCAQEVKHYHLHLIPVYDSKEKKPVEEIFNILKK